MSDFASGFPSYLYAYLGDLSGSAYAWLGHFRVSEYLHCGHNTDDAESLDQTLQTLGEGRMPGSKTSDEPQGA